MSAQRCAVCGRPLDGPPVLVEGWDGYAHPGCAEARMEADAGPATDLATNRCPDCGGTLDHRRVSEEGEVLEGCVCDGPYGEPTWVGL